MKLFTYDHEEIFTDNKTSVAYKNRVTIKPGIIATIYPQMVKVCDCASYFLDTAEFTSKGVARCADDDVFNFETGRDIAEKKAHIKAAKTVQKRLADYAVALANAYEKASEINQEIKKYIDNEEKDIEKYQD